jgi:hypothetical protein
MSPYRRRRVSLHRPTTPLTWLETYAELRFFPGSFTDDLIRPEAKEKATAVFPERTSTRECMRNLTINHNKYKI